MGILFREVDMPLVDGHRDWSLWSRLFTSPCLPRCQSPSRALCATQKLNRGPFYTSLTFCQLVNPKAYRLGEIAGKDVFDSTASKIGVVKDLSLDASGDISLVVEDKKGEETFIPYGQVSSIGDAVLLSKALEEPKKEVPKEEISEAPPTPPAEVAPVCANCGQKNKTGTKFCIKCGTKLGT